MMNTLISLNDTSSSEPRAWWKVRGALRAALVLVTAIAIAMCLEPTLRTALRVTLLAPTLEIAQAVFAWEGWLPLGFATATGALAALALRRIRPARQSRSEGEMGAAA